jgi:hypothetical protein
MSWLSGSLSPTELARTVRSRHGRYVTRVTWKGSGRPLSTPWHSVCADKAVNIKEMCSWLEKGYRVDEFTSRDHVVQLAKFEALDQVFRGEVVEVVFERFDKAINIFRSF